jgi:hypothetical protein
MPRALADLERLFDFMADHNPKLARKRMLSVRRALVVIPSRNLVVVHRFDNDPPTKDVKTVFEWAYKGIGNAEFGPLLQLILDAEKE